MKIKSIKVLGNGMSESDAESLFDKIEVFAGYAFNKSHSVTYSIISYWMGWVKTLYPNEFYAAAITIESTGNDDDKLSSLMVDAKAKKIEVLPPDINVSTSKIEIDDDGNLRAPFQAVKGISDRVANYIVEYREKNGGRIEREDDLGAASVKAVFGKTVITKGHIEKLTKVGALASIIPGSKPAKDASRLRDQLELMPGFVVDTVKADRDISTDTKTKIAITRIATEAKECKNCTLAGGVHVPPLMGKSPKFMVVFDAPNVKEERQAKMLDKDTMSVLKGVFEEIGSSLTLNDGYYTTLVKSPKNDKVLSNEQINNCSEFLKREIEVLKPPVIVTMGSNSQRFFAPTLKGGNDLAGKAIYRADLDATIVFGLNPAQLFFDPSKAKYLIDCFKTVDELLS